MTPKLIPDAYLGDGVYASYDGYHLVLDLRAQEPTLPITRIALEPEVLAQLDRYRREIQTAIEQAQDDHDGSARTR